MGSESSSNEATPSPRFRERERTAAGGGAAMVFPLGHYNYFKVLVTMPQAADVEEAANRAEKARGVEEAAALKLQTSLRGYRSRKAFQEAQSYASIEGPEDEDSGESPSFRLLAGADEAAARSEDGEGHSGRGSVGGSFGSLILNRSASACDLKDVLRRTIDVFRRKRIVREAALIGKGITRTLSSNALILSDDARLARAAGSATSGADRPQSAEVSPLRGSRKNVHFLSARGTLERESLDMPSVQSMPLKKKHWLEAVDAKHRYGSNLSKYYEVWLASTTTENFFTWLDHGEGRSVNLEACPRSVLNTEVIKYCSKQEREKYEVLIRDGIMVYKQSGIPVHTMEPSLLFRARQSGAAARDPPMMGENDDHPDDIKQNDTWIFVCSPEGRIYVGKKRLNPSPRFQHSSFLAGGAALAAGQMDVHHGKVVELRAFSGHYRPKRENLLAFLQMLHESGVDTRQVRSVHHLLPPVSPFLLEDKRALTRLSLISSHLQVQAVQKQVSRGIRHRGLAGLPGWIKSQHNTLKSS